MQRIDPQKSLATSLCLLVPLLVLALVPLPDALEQGPAAAVLGVAQLALALGVCWLQRGVLRQGGWELRRLDPGGAALALLGACAALVYGAAALFAGIAAGAPVRQIWYFETAALLPTLAAGADWFWQRLLARAAAPLFGANRCRAKTARRLLPDGGEATVTPSNLRPGDVILVRAGEILPADGTVREGVGAVEEQSLTGEKEPVKKFPGSAVCAGTVLREGALTCEVERVRADTTQARLAALAAHYAGQEGPLARQARRYARKVTVRALALAGAAFLLWLVTGFGPGIALGAALAVLAVASPLALLPGVTAALWGAAGAGARQGLYFRTLAALEQTGRVRAVALDAAAALDAGEPQVVQVTGTRRVPEKFLLSMAAGLCLQSADPLARAILRRAEAGGVKYTAVAAAESVPGGGLRGKVAGKVIAGGSAAFIEQYGALPPDLREAGQALEAAGATPLYFVLAGSPAGVIGISRAVRPDAAPAVARMQALGLSVRVLTAAPAADGRQTARQAGLDEDAVAAGLDEGGFCREVAALQAAAPTALVGGRDTPAAAWQAAGLAVQIGAAEGPLENAGLLLMRRDLTGLPEAAALARQTREKVRAGLRGAVLYHGILPVLAALGPLLLALTGVGIHPLAGALAACAGALVMADHALGLRRGAPGTHEDQKIQETGEGQS